MTRKIQLAAVGQQDYHFTGNPQISYFKKAYRRHTNFAIEPLEIELSSSEFEFGTEYLATITKKADLLHKLYLEIDISGKYGTSTPVYTVTNFTNSFINVAEIKIGSQLIDKQTSQFVQMYSELTSKKSKQQYPHHIVSNTAGGLKTSFLNKVGDESGIIPNFNDVDRYEGHCPLFFGGPVANEFFKYSSNTLGTDPGPGETKFVNENLRNDADQKIYKKLYYNFNFWFNKDIGNALPLSALLNHTIQLLFKTETKDKLRGNVVAANLNIEKIKLIGDFIELEGEEKRRFSQSSHEYLIEQVQYQGLENTGEGVDEKLITLSFNQPVKYMIWGFINEGTLGSNQGQGPCYFVSQTYNSLYFNDGFGKIIGDNGPGSLVTGGNINLEFNGSSRIDKDKPITYFTRELPYKYCEVPPMLDRIGIYSFALKPFNLEPSGTCNFSRILNKRFKYQILNFKTEFTQNIPLYIFAVNYNILRISSGMGMILYT